MTKSDLIEKIAQKNGLTQKAAAALVGDVFAEITASVAAGEDVRIAGFGSFEKHHRDAKKSRNPATGEMIDVAAKDVPVFKAAKAFKDAVAE